MRTTTSSVAGVGVTPFGRYPDQGLPELSLPAVTQAVADAAVDPADIDLAIFGNAYGGLTTGQESVRGQVALNHCGFSGLPVINVENACASSSTGLHLATTAIASGAYHCVLVVGAEKLFVGDTGRSISALATSTDVNYMTKLGMQFTALYALQAQEYMRRYGATEEHLAMVAAQNSSNSALNPRAAHRRSLSVEDVLASRAIAGPLRLLMCSSMADGAAAAVVVSDEYRRRQGLERCVSVLWSGLRSGTFDARSGGSQPMATVLSSQAYAESGVPASAVDLVELHDAAANSQLSHIEALQLVKPGNGWRVTADGSTARSGPLPVNPSGGLLGRGHPAGATGLAQIAEVTWQLRGEAGDLQVSNGRELRVGMCLNTGGRIGDDRAAVALHLLAV